MAGLIGTGGVGGVQSILRYDMERVEPAVPAGWSAAELLYGSSWTNSETHVTLDVFGIRGKVGQLLG
ncbi:hypothetical protein [Mycobacterium lepromatosis]|uniref:hypothetical protein n=1 Tax=Mycobacterium lepromatosis TaxID=480418 RepID=UPI0005F7D215|nr:hypothetical protein [Mycobacterium lepromatosis]